MFPGCCKPRNIFNQREQASASKAAYQGLLVHTTSLGNLSNFKDVLCGEEATPTDYKDHEAAAFRSSQTPSESGLGKHGRHMDHTTFTGMPAQGV